MGRRCPCNVGSSPPSLQRRSFSSSRPSERLSRRRVRSAQPGVAAATLLCAAAASFGAAADDTNNTTINCDCWRGTKLREELEKLWRRVFRVGILMDEALPAMPWLNTLDENSCNAIANEAYYTNVRVLGVAQFAAQAFGLHGNSAQDSLTYESCPPGRIALLFLCAVKLWAKAGDSINLLHMSNAIMSVMLHVFMEAPLRCFETWPFTGTELLETYAEWIRRRYLSRTPQRHQNSSIPSDFAWQHSRAGSTTCPTESRDIVISPNSTPQRIACLNFVVWPEEVNAMCDQARYQRPYCDWFGFFVVVDIEEDWRILDTLHSACDFNGFMDVNVVNLRRTYRMVLDDWHGSSNNVQKFHHAVLYTGEVLSAQADWFCFIESDVYFIPDNFKNFLMRTQLHGSGTHWVGGLRMHSQLTDGILVEPMQGSCLSKGALERITNFLQHPAYFSGTGSAMEWPPSRHACEPFRPSMHSEVMEVANICFRRAGVFPEDPRMLYDAQGRTFWPLEPLNGFHTLVPLRTPLPFHFAPTALVESEDLEARRYLQWQGKAYIYWPCLNVNAHWAADFPVMFHGHVRYGRNHSRLRPVAGDPAEKKQLVSKPNFWPSALHALLRGGVPCPAELCGGYAPRAILQDARYLDVGAEREVLELYALRRSPCGDQGVDERGPIFYSRLLECLKLGARRPATSDVKTQGLTRRQ
eukprot:TRINITY_DN5138_c0_g2_i1.p1 TRINITY_DN5138_c0_g2~~TRINITY_DN5138_c0_g2_i1.p1  ORF type:complete len:697 (-),score=75.82 TRINITY_DN5138_c0_g2_i1:768-2858(-)